MNLFQQTLQRQNLSGVPPIWFMRQAGRYHSHYQHLRKTYSFVQLCRNPAASAEAALGPIQDFDFDAAILFSDILFPLEAMGISLEFNPAPQLGRLLRTTEDLSHYRPVADAKSFFAFQYEALIKLRQQLPAHKGLIGFIGGPLTLYQFAVEGSGKTEIAPDGLHDGRFSGFMEKLIPLLVENMAVQAAAPIDCLAILDSSAGILPLETYRNLYLPYLTQLVTEFHRQHPSTPLLYYSKGTHAAYWQSLHGLPLQALGVDHYHSMAHTLSQFSETYTLQGNIAPEWMNLSWSELEPKLYSVFQQVKSLPLHQRRGWICGLGHGIQPGAKEDNVRRFVALARQFFAS